MVQTSRMAVEEIHLAQATSNYILSHQGSQLRCSTNIFEPLIDDTYTKFDETAICVAKWESMPPYSKHPDGC